MRKRKLWLGIGVLVILLLLIGGYFIVVGLIRSKVETALHSLPASLEAGYSSLRVSLFKSSVDIEGLHGRGIAISRLSAEGIGFWTFLRSHRLSLQRLHIEGCSVEPKAKDSSLSGIKLPVSAVDIGVVEVDSFRYAIPGADEIVIGWHLEIDSHKKTLRLDSLRVHPSEDKFAIGRERGHQVDVARATIEGVSVEGLEVADLFHHDIKAHEMRIKGGHIYVFRDRRLPLAPGEKLMPIEGLKSLPVTLRVGSVEIGPVFFAYEEYPAKGDEMGELKIFKFKMHIAPLINHPAAGDPDYMLVRTAGSLMNSGSVTATTLMPLRKGDPYRVEGTFRDLDVTSLNNPAEHLGHLHLESGMLNFLDFRFEMNNERSTGQIIGEYHNLVVDKLKDNGKVAKLKSFALKKFIIPRNKDKSLPVKKRTGKVDYKRDPQRYFSYYLLHSLLVGVKASFSLGFLLPG